MSVKDLETLRDDLLSVIEDNLPAKLDEIDAEKADGITLDDVPREAWFRGPSEEVYNNDPFAVYGFEDVQMIEAVNTAASVTFTFEIAFESPECTDEDDKKALRYMRALKEIFTANEKKFSRYGRLQVRLFAPAILNDGQGKQLTTSGIQITTTIAG